MKTKQTLPFLLIFLLSAIGLFYACSKKEKVVPVQSTDTSTKLQYYRSLLNSKKLTGTEFYKVLNIYEGLVRDSLIKSSQQQRVSMNTPETSIIQNSLIYVTTLKYCSTSGQMQGSGNGILFQTGSNSTGSVQASAFGISGEHGAITQVGNMERGSTYNGVYTVRLYLQGSFSTSTTNSAGVNGNLNMGSTSVGATAGYSSTSGGFSSQIYVVSANIQNGCPVAIAAIVLPPGTQIEPIP